MVSAIVTSSNDSLSLELTLHLSTTAFPPSYIHLAWSSWSNHQQETSSYWTFSPQMNVNPSSCSLVSTSTTPDASLTISSFGRKYVQAIQHIKRLNRLIATSEKATYHHSNMQWGSQHYFRRLLILPMNSLTRWQTMSSELDKVASLKRCIQCRWSRSQGGCHQKQSLQKRTPLTREQITWSETNHVIYHRCCRTTNKLINNSCHDFFQWRLKGYNNSGEQWKIANELLHMANCYQTRSDSEIQYLCYTFSSFILSKIQAIKQSITTTGKLSSFPNSSPYLNLSLVLPLVHFLQSPTLKPSNSSTPTQPNPHHGLYSVITCLCSLT